MMPPVLIYDGECPFCSNYVKLLRLREVIPNLQLLDARTEREHPAVKLVATRGLLIDEGMALVVDGEIYHGADSIHALADQGAGAAINRLIFRSRTRARLLYPALRAGRNLVLRILGRRKLGY